jgi:hypothetical protein
VEKPQTENPEASPASRRAAVYRLYDADGVLLYIGSSYDPDHRCKAHQKQPWWPQVARRTEEWHPGRGHAYTAELAAIAVEGAKHNRMGTPTYRTPVTAATLRRDELSRRRGQAQAESWRVYQTTVRRLESEGVEWRDARWMARVAAVDYLDGTGLLPGYVGRERARLMEDAPASPRPKTDDPPNEESTDG